MLPVGDQLSVTGSKSSAVAVAPSVVLPPATSTLPSGKSVAVCSARGIEREAAGTQPDNGVAERRFSPARKSAATAAKQAQTRQDNVRARAQLRNQAWPGKAEERRGHGEDSIPRDYRCKSSPSKPKWETRLSNCNVTPLVGGTSRPTLLSSCPSSDFRPLFCDFCPQPFDFRPPPSALILPPCHPSPNCMNSSA